MVSVSVQSDTPVSKKLLSIADVAESLSISRSTVYNLINEGHLRTVRLGGRRLVNPADLDAYVAELLKAAS